MAVLPVQTPDLTGTALELVAAASGGDSFPNTGIEVFVVLNEHADAPRTVTFDSPNACNLGVTNAAHDVAVIVPGVDEAPDNQVQVGPFPTTRFNDGNNRVQVTYSDAAADLLVGVLRPGA